MIEGVRQQAELVARGHRDVDVELAGADRAHGAHQLPNRCCDKPPREQQRDDNSDERQASHDPQRDRSNRSTCCRIRYALMSIAMATISLMASKLSLVCRPRRTGGALSGETVSAFRGEVYLAIARVVVRRDTRVRREFRSMEYACAGPAAWQHRRQVLLHSSAPSAGAGGAL